MKYVENLALSHRFPTCRKFKFLYSAWCAQSLNFVSCAAGAGAGRLSQGVGAFASNFFPVCNGQESNITDCTPMNRSGECNSNKIFVTCFIDDPASGPLCRNSFTGSTSTAAPTAATSEVSTDTSVSRSSLTLTSTGSTDPTSHGTDYVSSIPSTNVGASNKRDPFGTTYIIIIIIIVAVSSVSVLCLFMVITFAVIKYKCRHSKSDAINIHYKSDPIDVKESVLYSEITNDLEQIQQESIPIYETIKVTKSEDIAGIPATDVCPCPVDLKENIAYETSLANLKESTAYEIYLNPVNLQENITYGTSKNVNIATRANEVFTSNNMQKVVD